MKFGDNLRQIRKSKKMSQEQLAEKVNVTRQSVSKWENGESYPEMNNILELCKIFNCKLNESCPYWYDRYYFIRWRNSYECS